MREKRTGLSLSFRILAVLFASALAIVGFLQYRWFSRSAASEINRIYRSVFSTVFRAAAREYERYPQLLRNVMEIDAGSEEELKRIIVALLNVFGPEGTTPFLISQAGYIERADPGVVHIPEDDASGWGTMDSPWSNDLDMQHVLMLEPDRLDMFPSGFDEEAGFLVVLFRPRTAQDLVVYLLADTRSFLQAYVQPAVTDALPEYDLEWLDAKELARRNYTDTGMFDTEEYRFSLFRAFFGDPYLDEKRLIIPISPFFDWRVIAEKGDASPEDSSGRGVIANSDRARPPDWNAPLYVRVGLPENLFAGGVERRLAFTWLGVLVLLGGIGTAFLLLLHQVHRIRAVREKERDFVAAITHELRTPLAVIQSAADNLSSGIIPVERFEKYGPMIKSQTRRLSGMIEEILVFSGLEGQRPRGMDPVRVCFPSFIEDMKNALSGPAGERGIDLFWDTGGLPEVCMCDPDCLRLVLENLVMNAVNHAYAGSPGPVRIIGRFLLPSMVVFSVEDEGRGISPAERKQVFEPFYRGAFSRENQEKGSGLGLYISRRKARISGGDLVLESPYERIEGKKQAGCRFVLTLPCKPGNREERNA